ncbi:MAG: hypothetical protein HOC94_03910, partial [Waddliaceae bacterium]|nr:hypothetical protein [Waddliaceae bacterium]
IVELFDSWTKDDKEESPDGWLAALSDSWKKDHGDINAEENTIPFQWDTVVEKFEELKAKERFATLLDYLVRKYEDINAKEKIASLFDSWTKDDKEESPDGWLAALADSWKKDHGDINAEEDAIPLQWDVVVEKLEALKAKECFATLLDSVARKYEDINAKGRLVALFDSWTKDDKEESPDGWLAALSDSWKKDHGDINAEEYTMPFQWDAVVEKLEALKAKERFATLLDSVAKKYEDLNAKEKIASLFDSWTKDDKEVSPDGWLAALSDSWKKDHGDINAEEYTMPFQWDAVVEKFGELKAKERFATLLDSLAKKYEDLNAKEKIASLFESWTKDDKEESPDGWLAALSDSWKKDHGDINAEEEIAPIQRDAFITKFEEFNSKEKLEEFKAKELFATLLDSWAKKYKEFNVKEKLVAFLESWKKDGKEKDAEDELVDAQIKTKPLSAVDASEKHEDEETDLYEPVFYESKPVNINIDKTISDIEAFNAYDDFEEVLISSSWTRVRKKVAKRNPVLYHSWIFEKNKKEMAWFKEG